MKTFAMTLTAAGMVLGSALPVLAQDTMIDAETLTCAQFMALGAEDQARAVTELQAANAAAGSTTGTSTDTTATDTGEAQTDSSAAATSTQTDKSSSTDDTAADVATGTTSATDGANADVTALQTACTGQDAMLAKDVMVN